MDVLERVTLILRRDLKLGPDAKIPPDMPFFGGDADLDSLDVLLLVTSVEKEFGLKIPSEQIGKEIFQNVGTLVAYIERTTTSSAGVVASATTSSPVDHLERLPHREPFRFVTRVLERVEGISSHGIWSVTGTEAFFAGHFPGNPIVPGVLLTEALAQISGIAVGGRSGGMLALIDVRFDKPVRPPAEITLKSRLKRTIGQFQQFDVAASVGGDVVASGTLTLHRPAEGKP